MFLPMGICQDNREYLLKGMADIQMERNEAAIENLTLYLETDNTNHLAYLFRAEAHFNLKNWNKAVSDFETANSIKPGSGNLGLARAYASTGDATLAVQHLENHLRSEYRVPEKVIFLDKTFEKIEDSREWRNLWRNDWYSDREHILRDLEYLIGNEAYEEALGVLKEAIQKYPENDEFHSQKARIHVARLEFKQALSEYDLALKYRDDHPDYLAGKAEVLHNLKRSREAITALNRAIYVNPLRLDLYPVRARLYFESGELSRALDDIETYLAYFTGEEEALYLSGRINQEMGKYYPALDRFNQLIQSNSGNPRNFFARGMAYLEAGTYRYAIEDFGMALDLDPSDPLTYLNRGKAFIEIGDVDAACYDFDKARRKGNKEAYNLYYKHCE